MDDNNEKSEPTYWETQSSTSTPDTTQPPLENTPYQAQENPFLQSHTPQPLAKKKKTPKVLVALIIVMVIVGAGAAVAFAFKDRIMNTIAMSTKSAKEYYVDLEQKLIDEHLDSLTSDFNLSTDVAQKSDVEFTYNKELVDSLLSTTGISISDIENELGMSLDSFGVNSTIIGDQNAYYGQLDLILNKKSLISAEVFLDYLTKELSILLPELSGGILKYNLEGPSQDISDLYSYGLYSNSFSQEKIEELINNIKEEELIDFIKRYSTVILDTIDDVELEKGVDYSIDDIDVTANRLTIVIDGKNLQDIAIEVLEQLKKDSYIQSFLPIFEVSKEEYQNSIDLAIAEVKSEDMASEEGDMTVELYVDQNGAILGRHFDINDDGDAIVSFGYGLASKGNKTNYKYYLSESSENTKLEINGSHVKEGHAYTGQAKLNIDSDMNVSISVSYDDFETTIKDGKPYYDGKIEMTSLLFMGVTFGVDMSSEDNTQEVDFHVSMAKENLFNIKFTTELLKKSSVPSLPKDAVSYDIETEIDQYAATIDIEGFLASLSEKLGVNVSDLFNDFFYNGLY